MLERSSQRRYKGWHDARQWRGEHTRRLFSQAVLILYQLGRCLSGLEAVQTLRSLRVAFGGHGKPHPHTTVAEAGKLSQPYSPRAGRQRRAGQHRPAAGERRRVGPGWGAKLNSSPGARRWPFSRTEFRN
jgi:hypothetical protein